MSKKYSRSLSIKNWATEDRPREKLVVEGVRALSETELLAILIRSGTHEVSAVDVAKQLFQSVDNSLNKLARLSVKEFMQHKGIGQTKAITIMAAVELGRRKREEHVEQTPKIQNSEDAFNIIRPHIEDLPCEEFWVLFLNRANRVVKKQKISQGGVSGTLVDPRLVYKVAIEELASGIILVHNHPSGDVIASQQDIFLTKKLKEGSELLDIKLLDHLIVSGKKYTSLSDEGEI